ncbi:MAG: hypothetical protein IOB81_17055, partial [Burkholderia sp.]|nr:hypothetical protein [Burkholderia sp.]
MNSDLQKLTIHNALHRDLAPSEWRRTLRVTNTPDAISAKVQDINARLRLAAQHIPLDPQRLATGQKVQGAGLALLVVGVACWLSREFAHQL